MRHGSSSSSVPTCSEQLVSAQNPSAAPYFDLGCVKHAQSFRTRYVFVSDTGGEALLAS